MRVAVTGRDGQVARALAEVGPSHGVEVHRVGRPVLDLAAPAGVFAALEAVRPDAIVSAAAYTAVDRAESEPDLVMAVNAAGAGAVAAAAARLGVPLLHLSTDYVFDGEGRAPYRETDPTGPLGVYGDSKLRGEAAVAAAQPRHAILRTAWVFAPFGSNFVRTMLRLGAVRDEIGVVDDQHGCPTAALDIAAALIVVARRMLADPDEPALRGTFHMTGQGEASWADVAEAIFVRSRALGGPGARVRRIATADYPTRARRPTNSRLDGAKLAAVYGLSLPPWRAAIDACVTRLLTD